MNLLSKLWPMVVVVSALSLLCTKTIFMLEYNHILHVQTLFFIKFPLLSYLANSLTLNVSLSFHKTAFLQSICSDSVTFSKLGLVRSPFSQSKISNTFKCYLRLVRYLAMLLDIWDCYMLNSGHSCAKWWTDLLVHSSARSLSRSWCLCSYLHDFTDSVLILLYILGYV